MRYTPLGTYSKEELRAVGFSSVGDNVVVSRAALFYAVNGSLANGVRIDAYSIMTGHIELRDCVHISPFCFLGGTGGSIVMEKNSGLSTHVSLFTKSDNYSRLPSTKAPKLLGNIYIGEHSIVGSGSQVMPGSRIEKNVTIGCHCVINEHIKEGTILVSRSIGHVNLTI